MNRKSPSLKSKRYFSLLEVLIAFFLISMCALPLIYPHAFIYRQTKEFAEEVDLDRIAGVVYSTILERLYANEFEWQQIMEGQAFPIDEELFRRAGITQNNMNWKGQFKFEVLKEKTNAGKNGNTDKNIVTVDLIATHLAFTRGQQAKPFVYSYQAVVRRTIPNENARGDTEENPAPKAPEGKTK